MADVAAIMDRLAQWRIPSVEDLARRNGPAIPAVHLVAGLIGDLQFVVTLDTDGRIEASVSLPSGTPAAMRHVKALCRRMRVRPPNGDALTRIGSGGLFWIVSSGASHG